MSNAGLIGSDKLTVRPADYFKLLTSGGQPIRNSGNRFPFIAIYVRLFQMGQNPQSTMLWFSALQEW